MCSMNWGPWHCSAANTTKLQRDFDAWSKYTKAPMARSLFIRAGLVESGECLYGAKAIFESGAYVSAGDSVLCQFPVARSSISSHRSDQAGTGAAGQKRYTEAESETLAGYNMLHKQTCPTVSWLQSARKDLVTIYAALKRPEQVVHFRGELAESKAPEVH
jgi:hypothetical protein